MEKEKNNSLHKVEEKYKSVDTRNGIRKKINVYY